MLKAYQISIPKPCSESWHTMAATQRGAFCASCQKEVIDFTSLTDTEIIAYLQKPGAGCGRFRPSQLNRQLVPFQPPSVNGSFSRLRTWIAGSLALLFAGLHFPLKAGIKATKIETVNNAAVKTSSGSQVSDPIFKTIRGTVKDEDGIAIPGAVVYIKGTSISTQTNTNGEFILKVPVGFSGKRIRIIARFIGYSDKELKIPVTRSEPVNISLCMDPAILGGIAMISIDSGHIAN